MVCFVDGETRSFPEVRWGKGGFVEGRLRSHILERCDRDCPLFSIDRPCARRGEFDQAAVRVSKVEAPASGFPRAFLFHRDSSRLELCFPVAQFGRWKRGSSTTYSIFNHGI